jgi:hypothetical protein
MVTSELAVEVFVANMEFTLYTRFEPELFERKVAALLVATWGSVPE